MKIGFENQKRFVMLGAAWLRELFDKQPGTANRIFLVKALVSLMILVQFLGLPGVCSGQETKAATDSNSDSRKYPALEIQNLWVDDITIEMPDPVFEMHESYLPLWTEALKHDENDLRQELLSYIEAIHKNGFDQTAVAEQVRGLISPDNHHSLNMAIASLLSSLNDKDAADKLFALLKPGRIELAQIVEPALGRWNHEGIKQVWMKRLGQEEVRSTLVRLAIKGLGNTKHKPAVPAILKIALDSSAKPAIRLEAAQALGEISNEFAEHSKTLVGKSGARGIVDRLCGIKMLAQDDSSEAVEILLLAMNDEEGAVAGAAWQRMLEIDAGKAVSMAAKCSRHADSVVRGHVVTALRETPTTERMTLLGKILSDPHPNVRVAARLALVELANQNESFDQHARVVGMEAVNGSKYQSIEQALVLLASIDHAPAAQRAVELLEHDHPKVNVAAAWALRVLKVKDVYPKMFNRANSLAIILFGKNQARKSQLGEEHFDQLAHLFDSFGETGYSKADSMLRKFVPKNLELLSNCRPAAITALGKLNAGEKDDRLVQELIRRVNDQVSEPPEDSSVCATSAVALARMNAKEALPDLRALREEVPVISGFDYACAWAIRELSGEEFEAPVAEVLRESGYNLEPTAARVREFQEPGTDITEEVNDR